MYLKSIEINGFKSFAKKIVFEFPHGITGIVGPNGSGKSNIGDAVRWVLGEQSAKQLRGARMEDVIFSGTQTRRPMGYAYVAITFDNEGHTIPLDYPEVTVARRVYRSGESEYLLNGSVCRRRDIVELFYDTGIGKEGYSIIGQGQVEKILSGKIEDSRELFDEAAGIAKYKKNRAVTRRSLEKERQNLERVTDVLSELERRAGPLEKQSEKAREYLKLKDREKELDLSLFLYDYDHLKEEARDLRERHDIVNGDLEETRDSYEAIKKENASLQEQGDKISQAVDEKEALREDSRTKKEEEDQQVLLLEQKREANLKLISHYEEIHDRDGEEILQKESQILDRDKEILSGKAALEEKEELLASKEAALEDWRGRQSSCEARIDLRNKEIFSIMSSHTDMKEKLSRYETMEEQLTLREAEFNSRTLRVKSDLKEARKKEQENEGFLAAAQGRLSERKRAYEVLKGQEDAMKGREEELQSRIDTINQEYMKSRSRYETLYNISERYEGYNRAIQKVMEQKPANPGIIGVVADIIKVEKRYETAIEIALGGALQNIVTEDNQVAQKMIRYLKKDKLGRATFLPLTNVRRRNIAFSPAILEDEGVIGVADSLVNVEDRFRNLIQSLLGRTIVVDTMDHALLISRKNNFSLRIVTVDGELLNPGGSITGGAYRHSGNLLGRKREIEECRQAMDHFKEERERNRETLAACSQEREDFHRQVKEKKEELEKIELRIHDLSRQEPLLKEKTQDLVRQERNLEKEYRILKDQLAEIREQKQELTIREEDTEEIHRQNSSTLGDLQEELAMINSRLADLDQEKNELTLQVSRLRQQLDFTGQEKDRLISEIAALRENQKSSLEEKARLEQENEEAGEKKDAHRLCAQETEKVLRELDQELLRLREDRNRLQKKQNLIFHQLEDENERLLHLEKENTRLQAREEKVREDLDGRISYMWDTYEITYNQARRMWRPSASAADGKEGAGTFDRHTVSSEVDRTETPIMTAAQAGRVRKEKKDVGRQIRDLGNVNVNAIEEYKEVGERYEFMKSQYEDILEAEKKLETMIEDLNKAMQDQFSRQFARIRETFTKVFSDLFEGGTASLELMDEEDILECGIRIIAQPPGKKLQNILLLSGGERALTAIALLFAIQKLKPSPFCLLDEIEAALDDANIDRFSRYLKRLAKDTQFIVITHRRGTMSAAEALYGITMQEKGVSTLISVDLIDDDSIN